MMKRRRFITNSLLASAGITLPIDYSGGQTTSENRPNIIYLFTDQQTATAMSCSGNPFLKTPGMDKMAAMGVRFKNCYATQPLCGPNRTCMFTGLYPHQTGAIVNMDEESNKVGSNPMLGSLLKDSGYDTAYFGKWHIASSTKNKGQHGFDEIWTGSTSNQKDFDDLVAHKVLEFAKSNHKNPYFVVGSFINPHNVCELARGKKTNKTEFPNCNMTGYPAPEKCPPLPINFNVPQNEPEMVRAIHDNPDNRIQYPTSDWAEDDWRQYLWGYYRLVEHVDQSILKLVNGLEEAGMLENTVIIFSSDHGEGVAQQHWNQKQVLYESCTNIPFMVVWKGHCKAGTENEGLISNGLDLFPTVCDLAKIDLKDQCQGKSIVPLLKGKKENINEFIVMETVFAQGTREYGLRGRCLRTPRYKYIVYSDGKLREQLFDMETDSGEMNNLAINEKFSHKLVELRSLLADWGTKANDNFNFIK
jgi:choline-sulfatase